MTTPNESRPQECLYAYTESQPYQRYPGYLNVTRKVSGLYEISVRTRDNCNAGTLVLSAEQFAAFRSAIWSEA